ncbi:tetratricopeptide repeat protein [Novosphingobium panipatense]
MKKQPPRQQRRSPFEWGVRLGLAGIVGWIGYLSVMQSVALVLPDARTEEAYALAPNNGRIAGRLSLRLSGPEASEADRTRAVAIARKALQYDPTAVEAVATLAADAFMRGDQAEGERLLAYSQTLSRRDLRTQLMAIELAVARDDIPGALRHYDIALRTKKNAPELLFPVLTSALTDPVIRMELVKILGAQPNWGTRFINHTARSDADPAASAAFFHSLQATRVPVPNAASVTLINRLLAARLFDDAWTYYAATRPGSDRRQSRDPAFRSAVEARSAFDWTAANSIGVSTAILPDATNGLFDFTVSMGNGGTLLQQLQMLPPATMFSKGIVSGSNSLCAPGPIGLYAAKPVAKSGGWNYRIHLRLAAGSKGPSAYPLTVRYRCWRWSHARQATLTACRDRLIAS